MNALVSPDRRGFLAAVLAGVGLVTLPACTALGAADPAASTHAALRLARLFARAESARRIGRVYLRQVPAEREAAVLVRFLADALTVSASALARLDDDAARRLVVRCVQADFAAGRTASLDGWVLSVTEARLYALTALVEVA
jgi:hypothetical protein